MTDILTTPLRRSASTSAALATATRAATAGLGISKRFLRGLGETLAGIPEAVSRATASAYVDPFTARNTNRDRQDW